MLGLFSGNHYWYNLPSVIILLIWKQLAFQNILKPHQKEKRRNFNFDQDKLASNNIPGQDQHDNRNKILLKYIASYDYLVMEHLQPQLSQACWVLSLSRLPEAWISCIIPVYMDFMLWLPSSCWFTLSPSFSLINICIHI